MNFGIFNDVCFCLLFQVIQVDLDPKVMDKFVFAIVQKRSSGKLHKEMLDLVSPDMEVQTLIMFTCHRGSNIDLVHLS